MNTDNADEPMPAETSNIILDAAEESVIIQEPNISVNKFHIPPK